MKAADTVLRTLEGLLLVVFGGMLLMLVDTGNLWHFINPKFSWLIASGGAGLFVLGIFRPFAWGNKPGLGRMAVLACFLLLASVAQEQARRAFAPPEAGAPGLGDLNFQPEPARTHDEIGGREYLRINPAELFALADKDQAPERVVFQGMVRHDPALGGPDLAAVARVLIVCCLADAVGVGFRVQAPGLGELPDGTWVRVAGRLERDPAAKGSLEGIALPGVVMTVINDQWLVRAEDVSPMQQPGMPYIFEIKGAPPFAY